MTTLHPSALQIQPGRPPDELPQTLSQIEPIQPPHESDAESRAPVTLFLTVDVEDSYFNRPILMSGDGIGRGFGVFGILDELDSRGLKATFFVNVYEKDLQPDRVVESIVREIAARGHEVGLHSHPTSKLEFYHRPLFRLAQADQVDVLRWGADLITEWTDQPPASFRGGGYALNDDTFAALREVGIAIDSSCFFPSPNNHNTKHTVNAIAQPKGVIEVPVTTVLRANGSGQLAQRKLDLDWLSLDDLASALETLVRYGAGFAMFMMHSFSFIEKQTRMPDQPPSPRARYVSKVDSDRYVEVYGPKVAMRESFAAYLDWIGNAQSLQVRTLRDTVSDLRLASSVSPDVVPIVGLP